MKNSVEIAAAVLRRMKPSAVPSRHTAVSPAAQPNTARRTPGSESAKSQCWARTALPAKKPAKAPIVISTSVTAAKIASFAHRTGNRRGTAASVARIIPVAYSPLIAITPATPIASCAKCWPASVTSSTFTSARPSGVIVAQLSTVAQATRTAKPIIPASAARNVSLTERSEVSLIHSDRSPRVAGVTHPECRTVAPLAAAAASRPPPGTRPRRA